MRVLVDDMLALMANLGMLQLPDDVELPLLTVYAFQLRTATAISIPRATEGQLQRVVKAYLPPGTDPLDLLRSNTPNVRVINPTSHVVAVAAGKVKWGSFVPAEVVAAAEHEGAAVRLSGGNSTGKLRQALMETGTPAAVWGLEEHGTSFRINETPLIDA